MATTMTEIPIKDLALTTAPAGKQLLVRDASAGLQRIDYDQIAKNLVENYGSSSLAGKNQSIKAAIDSLNSGLTQNIQSLSNSITQLTKANYAFYKQPVVTFNSSHTSDYHDLTITNSKGHPIFLMICGDNNPLSSNLSQLNVFIERVGGETLTCQVAQSNFNSMNVPFSVAYIDARPAGTYTYRFEITLGGSEVITGETPLQSIQCMAFEI